MKLRAAAALVVMGATIQACKSGETPRGIASTVAPAALAPVPANTGASKRPVFVRGPSGGAAVAPFIASELAKGRSGHYGVLVYVGATWCEPCQGFHKAVAAGDFDEMLAGVRMLEFDLDEDREPLATAGYSSELIPLIALPKQDGTASEHRIEGSIKGPDAVRQNLMPRLRAFLQGQAAG
ncbi:MAG TPA: thioredoxin [Polyangiaceae bacterium]|nr:thioredoxin [Polyangiaceae bacterium]